MVNLHDLSTDEAVRVFEASERSVGGWLAGHRSTHAVVRFVTGEGKHAKDGIPKIRQRLAKVLKERAFVHSFRAGYVDVLFGRVASDPQA
jgi:hypothetical protein